MLILIENTPRAYAWGSRDAMPELLGTVPTGEPQAELWLGAHPGNPATVAKAAPAPSTLIDLIERDPERYGVDGGQLPFLLKILAIGAPLSLQVHPNLAQAAAGFAAEEAAGVPRDAFERNYGDENHKPELLVALSEVSALSGFRPLADARAELTELALIAPAGPGRDALMHATRLCIAAPSATTPAALADTPADRDAAARRAYLEWALTGGPDVAAAIEALGDLSQQEPAVFEGRISPHRIAVLRQLAANYPHDAGVLVSILLNLVNLARGEAIYLAAGQLHAYLGGIAVEVMSASDNVLRAGLTPKHVDVAELLRIVDLSELTEPLCAPRQVAPGLIAWEPDVPDFCLMRARLCAPGESGESGESRESGESGEPRASEQQGYLGEQRQLDEHKAASSVPEKFEMKGSRRVHGRAEVVEVAAEYPLVLIATSGRVRVERPRAEFDEVASLRRGQSLYVSAGEPIELSGVAEVFIATVGRRLPRNQREFGDISANL